MTTYSFDPKKEKRIESIGKMLGIQPSVEFLSSIYKDLGSISNTTVVMGMDIAIYTVLILYYVL